MLECDDLGPHKTPKRMVIKMVGVLIIMSMFILYLFTTKNKFIRVVSLPLKIILVGAGFLMMLFFIEIIVSLMCI